MLGTLPYGLSELRHVRGKPVVVPGVEADHPRGLDRLGARQELSPVDQRHLAEHHAGFPFPHFLLDPVDQLADLDQAGNDDKKRRILALMHGVVPRTQADIGSLFRDLGKFRRRQDREQRDLGEFVSGEHVLRLGSLEKSRRP